MRVDLLATPGELEKEDLSGALAVVVDAVRATTTLLAALEAGVQRVHVALSVEEALEMRRSLAPEEVVLCGERGGRRIVGFDLGNSPLEFRPETVAGRVLVCTTTNGTRAVRGCAGAAEVLLGCFRNRRAVVRRGVQAIEGGNGPAAGRLVIVCAGKAGRLSLDDFLCGGLIVDALAVARPGLELTDGAKAARLTALEMGAPSAELLASTAAGRSLVQIGLGSDLEYCAELDVSLAVPRGENGAFVLPARQGLQA